MPGLNHRRVILCVALISVLILSFSGFSYKYGYSDHTEQLIAVQTVAGIDTLEDDWAVREKTSLDSPRFAFVVGMGILSRVLGIQTAYMLMYVIALAGIIAGVVYFVAKLFDSVLAGGLTVLLFFVGPWSSVTLGGNTLIYEMFLPLFLATFLSIFALCSAVSYRYWLAAGALGATIILHASIGFWISMTVIGAVLARELVATHLSIGRLMSRPNQRNRLVSSLPAKPALLLAIVSLVGLSPIIYSNLVVGRGTEGIYILAEVRHPHHYLPSTWGTAPWMAYGQIVAIAIGVGAVSSISGSRLWQSATSRAFGWGYLIILSSVMALGGIVFTELLPNPTIIKLQPFHIAYFPKIILFGAITTGFIRTSTLVIEKVTTEFDIRLENPSTVVSGIVASLLVLTIIGSALTGGLTPPREQVSDFDRDRPVYEWAREETPHGTKFIVPPSEYNARLGMQRPIVVDWKTFVFTADGLLEWKTRIDDVCGVEVTSLNDCEYDTLSEQQIRTISKKYDAEFILTTNETYSFSLAFQEKGQYVYRIKEN